jgi:predicted ATPase
VTKSGEHRFVAITGIGGIGKTTFAGAVARWFSRRRRFRNGILWVALSDIERIDILLSSVPGLLEKDPVDSIEKLVRLLDDQNLLLILDNLESVLGAEARASTRSFLNQLLRDTGRLRIVVTTRQLVGGIELGENTLELDRLDDESALNLLLNRAPDARRVLAEVRLNQSKNGLIYSDALRGLLDEFHGYPLAITTAAPHFRHLSVSELLGKIREPGTGVFQDPNIRDPVELTRMTSLAKSLGLSVQRLTEDGAAAALSLFGVLSLFPAGLTKFVLTQLELTDWEKNLWRLGDYSMVEYDDEDQRYYLLTPVRRFAQTYLEEGVRQAVIQRAIAIFAAMARELAGNWPSRGARATARLFPRDEPNFLAAIDFGRNVEAEALTPAEPLIIAASVLRLYTLLRRFRAGSQLSDWIVSDSHWQTDPAGLASVRLASGDLAVRRGQLEAAEGHYTGGRSALPAD